MDLCKNNYFPEIDIYIDYYKNLNMYVFSLEIRETWKKCELVSQLVRVNVNNTMCIPKDRSLGSNSRHASSKHERRFVRKKKFLDTRMTPITQLRNCSPWLKSANGLKENSHEFICCARTLVIRQQFYFVKFRFVRIGDRL